MFCRVESVQSSVLFLVCSVLCCPVFNIYNPVLLHLVAAVGYLGTVVEETHTAAQRTYTSLCPTTGQRGVRIS